MARTFLKRVIQAHVQNPLPDLASSVHDGNTVRIGVPDGAPTLNGEAVKAAT